MQKKRRVWILLADAGRARMFADDGGSAPIRAVKDGTFVNTDLHRHARDVGSDRPGRSIESAGSARHAEEPRVDLHRQEEERFAQKLAAYVAGKTRDNQFDDLILVAPPQLLGALRSALDPHTAKRVIREIDKDLTKVPAGRLAARLRTLVRPPPKQ